MSNKYDITHNTWNKLGDLYQEHFMDLDIYNSSYDSFCQILPEGAEVLELGCGPGNITRYLTKLRPDLQITATDVAPNMVALAEKNVPSAKYEVLDVRRLEG